jgi:hypothetical protein
MDCLAIVKALSGYLLPSLILTRDQREDISGTNEGSAMSVSSYVAGIEYEKSDRVSVVIATLTRPTKCNVTPARQ